MVKEAIMTDLSEEWIMKVLILTVYIITVHFILPGEYAFLF